MQPPRTHPATSVACLASTTPRLRHGVALILVLARHIIRRELQNDANHDAYPPEIHWGLRRLWFQVQVVPSHHRALATASFTIRPVPGRDAEGQKLPHGKLDFLASVLGAQGSLQHDAILAIVDHTLGPQATRVITGLKAFRASRLQQHGLVRTVITPVPQVRWTLAIPHQEIRSL